MVVCCECCLLSGRSLCDELITCPEESYRLWCVFVCDLESSRMGEAMPRVGPQRPGGGGICSILYWNSMTGLLWIYFQNFRWLANFKILKNYWNFKKVLELGGTEISDSLSTELPCVWFKVRNCDLNTEYSLCSLSFHCVFGSSRVMVFAVTIVLICCMLTITWSQVDGRCGDVLLEGAAAL